MRVAITEAVDKSIRDAAVQAYEFAGAEAARNLVEQLRAGIRKLTKVRLGSRVDRLPPNYYRYLINPYHLYYRIEGEDGVAFAFLLRPARSRPLSPATIRRKANEAAKGPVRLLDE